MLFNIVITDIGKKTHVYFTYIPYYKRMHNNMFTVNCELIS